jgi:hypothetical protein
LPSRRLISVLLRPGLHPDTFTLAEAWPVRIAASACDPVRGTAGWRWIMQKRPILLFNRFEVGLHGFAVAIFPLGQVSSRQGPAQDLWTRDLDVGPGIYQKEPLSPAPTTFNRGSSAQHAFHLLLFRLVLRSLFLQISLQRAYDAYRFNLAAFQYWFLYRSRTAHQPNAATWLHHHSIPYVEESIAVPLVMVFCSPWCNPGQKTWIFGRFRARTVGI